MRTIKIGFWTEKARLYSFCYSENDYSQASLGFKSTTSKLYEYGVTIPMPYVSNYIVMVPVPLLVGIRLKLNKSELFSWVRMVQSASLNLMFWNTNGILIEKSVL